MVAAIGIIVFGLLVAVWALASSPREVDHANQSTAGLGGVSDLMRFLPGGGARIVFALMGLALVALGVAVLASV